MTDSIFELEGVLKDHARRYPLLQPTDGVKLIYQNEFGAGHMISGQEDCLFRLREEYDRIEKGMDSPREELIGNGICRVNLAALRREELEALGYAFLRCARLHKGTKEGFIQKLEVLRRLTGEGCFSFDLSALDAYLTKYERAGFPPVSHSEIYRRAYAPAYRICMIEE